MKYKIYIIALLSAMLLHIGCQDNFLEIDPKTSTPVDSFFQNEEDAVAAINAAYASLQNRSMYSELYPKTVSGAADDFAMDNTDDLELQSYSWDANLRTIDNAWQSCYEGIFRANQVLQNVPDIDMDQETRDRILGEARFLRALYYWHLMALFGEVPLVTEANASDPTQAELPKSSSDEIISFMTGDLQMAADLLPATYDEGNIGRATEGAAKALLGKVHLYSASPLFGGNTEGYAMASDVLADVIDNYNYQLISDYSDLWVVDHNPEYIFEVMYADFGGNIWGIQDGSGLNENNLRATLNLPNGRGGNGNLLPRQSLFDEFENYSGETAIDGKDPRLFYSIWKQGDYFDEEETEYQSSWTPTGYALKKGIAPIEDRAEDGEFRNIPLIRFGDVLLMYAEAMNAKTPSEPQEAIDALNRVRNRVGMPGYPTAEYPVDSQQAIFEAIVHERRVELASEYQRYHDLRRWGLAEEIMGPLGYVEPRHNFFPIPQEEVDNNDQLEQNSNY